ncbi:M12 family metallo-peptidase [Methanoplanus limicola]|uniref:Uncharacterized protein n=1 Tax=Methanoplanus limicola DSM 2279 TaxID=937775 RepID=H1YWN3_9EURY|nr:M12 family metallo-peptidase [Methanoplanus limicola]EHQ36774.1 hypothetical protein Metlim_2739 [Methanoplanus limicola DSM 2279]
MKLKKGVRALSLLLVMALMTAMLVPAVSADKINYNDNLSIPLINIEGTTEKLETDQIKADLKIQSTIEKYDLVLFDIPKIRDDIFKDGELAVCIDGKNYSMTLKELPVNDKGVNPDTHSYTGNLKGVENSNSVLTISKSVLIASIILNGEEYCIDSLSATDSSGNKYHIEYKVNDVKIEGNYIYGIEDYLAHTEMSDEEMRIRNEQANIEEEEKASRSTAYVRILVMTDAKWIYDEPDWQVKAQNIISQANNQFGRSDIQIYLLATYDSSKAGELATDAQNIVQNPLDTFISHVSPSYLNSKSADIAIYLGGYDCTNPDWGVGATYGYDSNNATKKRYGWSQMADDPSPYDAIHHDRTVATLHEIGHLFDADHQDGMQAANQESYNRAYQWNSGSITQSVVWAPVLRSTSYEYSSNDYNGDYYHNNALRIHQTRNVVASYF